MECYYTNTETKWRESYYPKLIVIEMVYFCDLAAY